MRPELRFPDARHSEPDFLATPYHVAVVSMRIFNISRPSCFLVDGNETAKLQSPLLPPGVASFSPSVLLCLPASVHPQRLGLQGGGWEGNVDDLILDQQTVTITFCLKSENELIFTNMGQDGTPPRSLGQTIRITHTSKMGGPRPRE